MSRFRGSAKFGAFLNLTNHDCHASTPVRILPNHDRGRLEPCSDAGFRPAADNFDVGLIYSFERVPKAPQVTEHSLGTAPTGYLSTKAVKPFVDIDLGYLWEKTKTTSTKAKDDRATFGSGAGVEVAAGGSAALLGRAGLNDEFKHASRHAWAYTAGVDQFIDDNVAAVLDVTFHGEIPPATIAATHSRSDARGACPPGRTLLPPFSQPRRASCHWRAAAFS